jgi:hypothetical protein
MGDNTMSTLKMPIRTAKIALSEEYEGFEFTIKTSVPLQFMSDIQSGDFDRIQIALKAIVLGWNFPDEDGTPLPQPQEMIPLRNIEGEQVFRETEDKDEEGNLVKVPVMVSSISKLPFDLTTLILQKASEAIGEVPNA